MKRGNRGESAEAEAVVRDSDVEFVGRPAPADDEGLTSIANGPRPPPIVGIGASAGGLEPFVRLMSHLKSDSGLTYVVVQHLDPTHENALSEILSGAGSIPVMDAVDGVRLEPDHAYVIPPNASITAIDGHLRVVTGERPRGVQTVIDRFLESIATVHGSEAVAVILSGAGSDGARGVRAVKEHGGITIAQDPGTAQFSSMPESAIATGCVDFVLSPDEIAAQLSLIGKHFAVRADDASNDEIVEEILVLLRRHTGTDFRSYRRATVRRRILRRMLAHRSANHAEYLERLREHPEDLDGLYADLLIGVTRFFRDPEMFTALRDAAFPEMMRTRDPDAPIRLWVAGCSGGEEAYSMAIALIEYLEATGAGGTPIHVFATDLSESAIARARAGVYPKSIETDVSADRLRRFFVSEDDIYRVSRRVRDLCVFATQNIIHDPPFSQLDLISCRNVLIYFEPSLQERIIPMFNYALKPHGILVLGASESVGQSSEYFTPFDKRHRIFRPQAGPRRLPDTDHTTGVFPLRRAGIVNTRQGDRAVDRPGPEAVRRDADAAVLQRFGPPGVVINDRLEVTQFRGDTTGFVQPNAGVASLHLFKLVRPDLLPRLRAALEAARSSREPVREEQIPLRDGDAVRHVAIEVIPFRSGGTRDRFFVILFDSRPDPVVSLLPVLNRARRSGERIAVTEGSGASAIDEAIALREELAEAKRFLQDVIDQYEGADEELRAANEEIQSANEELQSTTEELETTKEEVQSTNEELTTVNEELRHRNRELAAASADLSNVFSSTQIPILIVSRDLLVRRFTPVTERVMKVIPTDVGRPLGDLRLRINVFDLEARVAAVIATLTFMQIDVQDDREQWWSLTIRPYLTVDGQVDGAVLVFTDIDLAKKSGATAAHTSEQRRVLLVQAEAARADAVEANAAKTSFLANMSHDLRTPLNAISGYADLLEMLVHGPLTPTQEHDVSRIKRSARHLLSLINDILNFAKLETGTADIHLENVDVDGAITSLEAMLYPQLRAKGLAFNHTSYGGLVRADAEKLQQVLLNMTTNAIKFTPSGSITVRCENGGAMVTIDIIDTGVGIAADQFERIFEPFIQVNRSLTNVNNDGVGLGLAISRNLARAMGGDLTVQSIVGEGSRFRLTLPRAEQALVLGAAIPS